MSTFIGVVAIILLTASYVISYILGVHDGEKSCERRSVGTLLVTTDAADGSKYANLIFDSAEDQQITMHSTTGTEVVLTVKQQIVET